jgi:hypothetical protein
VRVPVLSLLALLAFSPPAFATGGFGCSIEDANVTFDAEAGFSYSIGSGLLNFRGTLALPKGIAPKGLEKVALSPANLPHDWLYDRELRLLVHVETEGDLPFASVDLVVMTKAAEDDISYEGTYTLSVFTGEGDGRIEKSGKVVCSVG